MKTQSRLFLGILCLLMFFFPGNTYAEKLNCKCPCRPKPPPTQHDLEAGPNSTRFL
jgi:hypothetical protein